MNPSNLKTVERFLNSLGLITCPIEDELDLAKKTQSFFAGIYILKGTLYYSSSAHAGDLLHEAGHIATCPQAVRPYLSTKLPSFIQLIKRAQVDPLDPRYTYWSDAAAIGWSVFTCREVDIPCSILYEGTSWEEGEEVIKGIESTIEMGFNVGSAYTVPLYYSGMISNKGARRLDKMMQI